MSNSGLDQFWTQATRQQQPQGLDIVEIVRHLVPAILNGLSATQQGAGQQSNNALPTGGLFGQQNFGQANQAQQSNNQLQPQQIAQLIQAIVGQAVLHALSGGQQQQAHSQNWGAQPSNAGNAFNLFANAQQGNGPQAGQQGQQQSQQLAQLIQAILPAVLNGIPGNQQHGGAQNLNAAQLNGSAALNPLANWQQQSNGLQGLDAGQAQGLDLNTLIQILVPALINAGTTARQWTNTNAQQGGFQQADALQPNAAANSFGAGQNAFDQQQQLQGVDLSLLIKAIVPDITKAVVPIVLSTLSGPQQQSRHIN